MEFFLVSSISPSGWHLRFCGMNNQMKSEWYSDAFVLTVSLSPIFLILDVLCEVIQHFHGYKSLNSRAILVLVFFFLLKNFYSLS